MRFGSALERELTKKLGRRVGHPSRGIESGCRTLWFLEGSGFSANFKRKRNEHAPANHSIHSFYFPT